MTIDRYVFAVLLGLAMVGASSLALGSDSAPGSPDAEVIANGGGDGRKVKRPGVPTPPRPGP
jgi:hypothetical protein